MAYIQKVKLPDYFYSVTHPARWVDPFATAEGEDRLVLSMEELRARTERNRHYSLWLGKRGLKGKQMKWQAIQVLSFRHSESNPRRDWWENYQDALFRVFVQPETLYDSTLKEWKQWYVLCPEDAELTQRYEAERRGPAEPPRDALKGERWVSKNPKLRKARLIPVECCRHWRHETTAGRLPEGL